MNNSTWEILSVIIESTDFMHGSDGWYRVDHRLDNAPRRNIPYFKVMGGCRLSMNVMEISAAKIDNEYVIAYAPSKGVTS
jgi:hypothetical protein